MMLITARCNIAVFDRFVTVTGEGANPEEAIQNCLQQVRNHISLVLALTESVSIPLEIVGQVPLDIPKGMVLVIFERCSHSDGEAYDWRFYAVPVHGLITASPGWYLPTCGKGIKKPVEKISFVDTNSEYYFKLPQGSLEYTDGGGWKPVYRATYHY